MRRALSSLRLFVLTLALAAGGASAQAQTVEGATSPLFFEPPAFDLNRLCKAPPAIPKPALDWSKFEKRLPAPPADAVLAARWFNAEEDGKPRDAALASRILEAVLAKGRAAPPEAEGDFARMLLKPGASAEEVKRGLALLESAVSKGSPPAALHLARMYERGQFVPRDPEKARRFFQIAALAGESEGQTGLARLAMAGLLKGVSRPDAERMALAAMAGLMGRIAAGDCTVFSTIGFAYRSGSIAPRNDALAIRWLEKAAELGNGPAAEVVASAYRLGQNAPQSDAKAFAFLTVAAKAGRIRAMADLGAMLLKGDGVARDRDGATAWLEKAASAGRTDLYRLLQRGWNGEFGDPREPARAFAYLKAQTELPSPDPEALLQFGEALLAGDGTPKDEAAAVKALDRAARNGAPKAAVILGDLLQDRKSPLFDAPRAARYYRIAALGGNSNALAALSDMHACGLGVPFSATLARSFEERAAYAGSSAKMNALIDRIAPGDTPLSRTLRYRAARNAALGDGRGAMVEMALMSASGFGVTASAEAAAKWRALAFRPGDGLAEAHLAMARALTTGRLTTKNLSEARTHLEEAVRLGHPAAKHQLGQLLRQLGASDDEVLATFDTSQRQGNETSLRAIANALPQGAVYAGKSRLDWITEAAAAGDPIAALELAASLEPAQREKEIDRIVSRGACQPEEMIAAALAYAGVGSDSATASARTIIDRMIALDFADRDITFRLADALIKGVIGPEGVAKGEALLERAAQLGHPKALALASERAMAGAGNGLDEAATTELLQKAAASGDMKSATRLVRLLATRGEGAAPELEKLRLALEAAAETRPEAARIRGRLAADGAFGAEEALASHRWFEKAALAGDTPAMRELANLHLLGIGLPASAEKAFEWQLKAAEAGDLRAARDVALAYEAGFGVAPNPEKAKFWAGKATAKLESAPVP